MTIYKVYYKNYKFKRGELLGTLTERRKDLRGKNTLETGLKWAKWTFGHTVKDQCAIFIVPDKSNLKNDIVHTIEERCSKWNHLEVR